MPYENFRGVIKVPERIARCSACIAVCIYRFVQRGVGGVGGEGSGGQTALQYWGYLHPGQREARCQNLQMCIFLFFCWGGGGGGEWVKGRGHMHGVRELVQPSTTQLVTRKQNTAKKRLLLIGQHHVTPTGNLELLVKTLNMDCLGFSLFDFFFPLFFF